MTSDGHSDDGSLSTEFIRVSHFERWETSHQTYLQTFASVNIQEFLPAGIPTRILLNDRFQGRLLFFTSKLLAAEFQVKDTSILFW